VLGGLGFGIALAFLVELILRPIRSVSTLTKIVGAPPLSVVPVLSKKRARVRRKSRKERARKIKEDQLL
jgi:hypothetical protein